MREGVFEIRLTALGQELEDLRDRAAKAEGALQKIDALFVCPQWFGGVHNGPQEGCRWCQVEAILASWRDA
jgi:hypothetical protein